MNLVLSMSTNSLLLSLVVSFLCYSYSKDTGTPVTYGSVVKLVHGDTGKNLHSHGIAWGSGSGQQSVTTTGVQSDKGSLWLIKEDSKAPGGENIGTPVKCNSVIRLEHADTSKNLHSHLFRSPLSGQQEVSAFGDSGEGDSGDNWKVVCEAKGASVWERLAPVSFVHQDTTKYLSSSGTHTFTHQNCGHQCPILDQSEVASSQKKTSGCKWKADQGVYFPGDASKFSQDMNDEEL